MSGPGRTFVKNTFLEIPEPSLTQDAAWRRQSSEPVATISRDNDDDVFLTDSEDGLMQAYCHPYQFPSPGLAPPNPFQFPVPILSATPLPCDGNVNAASPQHCLDPGPVMPQSVDPSNSEKKPPRKAALPPPENKMQESKPPGRRNLNRLKDNDITKMPPPWTDITTVMMRNLPNRYSQQRLLDELHKSGFAPRRHFDFFYLPMDHGNAANLGYCFINFTETCYANAFAEAFMGKQMQHFKSNKTVVVMAASIQGYEKNHAYYSCTRIVLAEDTQYRPLFFRETAKSSKVRQAPSKPNALRKEKPDNLRKRTKAPKKEQGSKSRGSLSSVGEIPNGTNVSTMAHQTWPRTHPQTMVPTQQQVVHGQSLSFMDAKVVCMSCGQECRSEHRCCSSCGSVLVQMHTSRAWGTGAQVGISYPMTSGPMQQQMPMQTSVDRNLEEATDAHAAMQRPPSAPVYSVGWHPDGLDVLSGCPW